MSRHSKKLTDCSVPDPAGTCTFNHQSYVVRDANIALRALVYNLLESGFSDFKLAVKACLHEETLGHFGGLLPDVACTVAFNFSVHTRKLHSTFF